MGNPVHGINALIYVSGTELVGGNSWSLSIDPNIVKTTEFGDTWEGALKGAKAWSGNINAYDHGDSKLLVDAATAAGSVALLIYPNRSDTGDYYSGNAIFGASSDGNTSSAVNKNGAFTGDGTLTITGFA